MDDWGTYSALSKIKCTASDSWGYPNENYGNLPNAKIWFLQDVASPHFVLPDSLIRCSIRGWIGRRGVIDWPPRSPDLTPLDIFLQGYLKLKVNIGNHRLCYQRNFNLQIKFISVSGSVSKVVYSQKMNLFHNLASYFIINVVSAVVVILINNKIPTEKSETTFN